MRVISGKARHLLLSTPPGMDTRPTTDRIKETLFNILQNDIPGCRFLDLFAGSGGIAIEALSRGAESAVLVDNSPQACSCIVKNLEHTHLREQAMLLRSDVFRALDELEGADPFSIIFMDPPYQKGLEEQVLARLAESSLADEDTILIVEEDLEADFSYAASLGYRITRVKEYKTNMHVFLQKAPTAERKAQ